MTIEQTREHLAQMAESCGAREWQLLEGECWYLCWLGAPIRKAGVGRSAEDAYEDLTLKMCNLDSSFPALPVPIKCYDSEGNMVALAAKLCGMVEGVEWKTKLCGMDS